MSVKQNVSRGVWNTISNSYIVESLADKFDFVILDLEHGFRDFSECESQIRLLLNSKTSLYVRVRSYDDVWVQALLDLGVTRFLVPQIRSMGEVKEFVSKVRFPPLGKRGFHPKSTNLARQPVFEWGASSQPSIEIFPIVETAQSLEFLESLVSLEGVTGTYFGNYDLSIEISKGDRDSLEIHDAFARLVSYSLKNNREMICLSTDRKSEEFLVKSGVKFLVKGIDSQLIDSAFENAAKPIDC